MLGVVRWFGAATAALLAASGAFAADFDFGPQQPGRPHVQADARAIALLPEGAKFVRDGVFTVAIAPFAPPIATYATDAQTPVGADADIASLVADSLGRKLDLQPIAWADWPLGLTSGKYDAVISNVGVTEARKEKFDFSTYRQDVLGYYVKSDSAIASIKEPKDIAGLKVIVDSGTNQEQILLNWVEQNKKAGLASTEIQYYDDQAVRSLALQSGRADAYLGPNAFQAYAASQTGKTKLVGIVNGGWPLSAEIAVTTRKDSGIADAITKAINAQIKNGNYAKVLARWGLTSEAVDASRTNPPGLPKS